MCCALYEDEMFTQMEWHVLQTLGWVIGHPTVDSFLRLALDGAPIDLDVENMARYITEVALFHKEFISKRPSDLARSALTLARYVLDRPQSPQSDWVSGYDSHTLVTLSQQLHRPSQVLYRKYSSTQLSRVSTFLEGFLARQASIARCYATPPTPPSNTSTNVAKVASQHGIPEPCVTPQKAKHLGFNINGCLTPPITPNAPGFATHNPVAGDLRRPPTPASSGADPSNQRYGSFYPLPPIQRPTSIF